MKKIIFSSLLAALTFAACQEIEQAAPETSKTPAPEYLILKGTVEQSDLTKTTLSEDNEVLWYAGDCIATFLKSATLNMYQTTDRDAGKNYSEFEYILSGDKVLGEDWDHIVAYYPYSEDVECAKADGSYALDVELPATQYHRSNSFGLGAFPMVAVGEDTDLRFRNVCGAIKLEFKGDVSIKDVTIIGNKNEKLSGPAVVTALPDYGIPTIKMAENASTSVTMTCDEGWGELQSGDLVLSNQNIFIITVPPVEFKEGFTVTVTDSQGKTYTITTKRSNTVLRSSILVMPAIELPEKCDYVDEWGNNLGQGIEIDGTIWAPVNCGYHPTDFKYGKLYQWGRKYGQGYSSDGVTPSFQNGPVSLAQGQSTENENCFFIVSSPTTATKYSWLNVDDRKVWNSGTDAAPVKTQYDPCPKGWRVPTNAELTSLNSNKSSWSEDNTGLSGIWFSGKTAYSEEANRIFLPAGGRRTSLKGDAEEREDRGYYWSSQAYDSKYVIDGMMLLLVNRETNIAAISHAGRSAAHSVRCVQE